MRKRVSPEVRLFAAIWLLVLLLPPLRREPWRQVVPELGPLFFTDFDAPADPNAMPTPTPGTGLEAQEEAAESSLADGSGNSSNLEAMYRLVGNNPGVIWLKADLLRDATRGYVRLEVDPTTNAIHARGISGKTWLLPADADRCIGIAEAGAKQEPDNAYFPIMEALFCFDCNREKDGWQALEQAKGCERYEDYVLQGEIRRISLADDVHPLIWSRRLELVCATILPQYGAMRSVGRVAGFRGEEARAAGDFPLALRRYEDALLIGRALRRNPPFYVQELVGEGIETTAWASALVRKPDSVGEFEKRIPLGDAYAALARKWGASDTVAEASRHDARHFLSDQLRNNTGILFPPVTPWHLRLAIQGEWVAQWLARLAWLGAMVWLAGLGVRRVFEADPPAAAVRQCAVFTGVALVVMAAGCLRAGAGMAGFAGEIQPFFDLDQVRVVDRIFGELALVFAPISVLFWWLGGLRRGQVESVEGPQSQLGSDSPRRLHLLAPILLASLGLAFAWLAHLHALEAPDSDDFFPWPIPPVLAGFFLVTSGALLWRNSKGAVKETAPKCAVPSKMVERGALSLVLLGQVSGRLALWSSMAYLAVVVLIWPFNAELDHTIRDLEHRGEVPVWLDRVNGR